MTEIADRLDRLSSHKRELVERLLREKGESFNTFPLSFAQERLWFLDRLQPGSSAYNIAAAYRAVGLLDTSVLRRVFREIVRRHEVLRTRFLSVGGSPVASVDPRAGVELPEVDLSALPVGRRRRETEKLLRRAAGRPFDLTRAGLLRLLLIRSDEVEKALLIVLHHIVTDGWSLGVLLREVKALYRAFAASRPSPLPPLPIQYADYARWQRGWLQSDPLRARLEESCARLRGAAPLLHLPADRPRPSVFDPRGGCVPVQVHRSVAERLEQLGRQARATPFMTFLAALQTFLYRLTGESDLTVGSPVANRGRRETEGLIGFFVNLVVLRNRIDGRRGFSELLREVRESTLETYAHQDVPFEMLVERLQPERDLSYSPLFQVMLMLQTDLTGAVELKGGRLEPVGLETSGARFDLTLALARGGDGLAGTLEYSVALFDRSTVGRFRGQLTALLEAVVADPAGPLSELAVLGRASRHQLLREWTDREESIGGETRIHRLFEQRARERPGDVALVFEGERRTYGALDRRANQLAHRLRDLGVGPEKVVGVALRRVPDLVAAQLGILKAGGAYLPLDPDYPTERLRFILDDAKVAALVAGEADAALSRPGLAVLEIESDERDGGAERGPEVEVDPGNAAYVIYTSGSTGRPKGVVVEHGHVINFFAGMDQRIGVGRPPGTWLAVTSISFDISVLELLWTLCRGARVVLQGESPRRLASAEGSRTAATRARGVDFSLFYFASADDDNSGDRYRLLLEGAKAADRLGLAAVWTPERHFHEFGGLYPNPATTGAAVAAVTEKVQIRAGSVVMPLHHPVRVAEEWSVVDNLSGGRAGVSFASGWHADDFVFAPGGYADRRAEMRRGIETVRKLWRGESCIFPGGVGQDVEVVIRPRPIQKELPFWLTAGGSPETFRLAGELGGGLLTHLLGQNVEDLRESIALYRRAWHEAGHGEGVPRVVLMLHTFVGDDLDEVRELVRRPFGNYLRSASGLMKNLWRSLGRGGEIDALGEDEVREFLDLAFERYFETSGLMGTVESCRRTVLSLAEIGVDEVACLIDFGVDDSVALAGLEKLGELRSACRSARREASEAVPLPTQLEREKVTHLQCTPSLAEMLVSDPLAEAGLRGLETLMLGGEALSAPLLERLERQTGAQIHNMYGPTETTVWSATHRQARGSGKVSIGREIANTSIRVLDRRFQLQGIGVPGELMIGGGGVTRGYLGRPALTARRYGPDPFAPSPGARLYATGDLARRWRDGSLEFLGRLDHQVKLDGHRIEPGEIETTLRQHPAIREALVVSRRVSGAERLVAYVVAARRGGSPRVTDERCRQLLAGHESFTLPNGMVVGHYDQRQALALYREVFADQSYLRHGITFADGDVVFDVGGNVGFFSLFAHQLCRPSKIYAFEPIPSNCALLRANLALYDVDAEIFECGVAEAAGEAEFVFYPRASGLSSRASFQEGDLRELKSYARQGLADELEGSTFSESEIEEALREHLRGERVTCRLRSLSDVVDEHGVEHIDLLKVDVEKSEMQVLQGIREDHWPKIRQVVLEVHGPELLAESKALLEARGFAVASEVLVEAGANVEGHGLRADMVYARRADGEHRRQATAASDEGLALSFAEIRTYLRERLPEYMVPALFMPLDKLPLTPNGKVDRAALPEPQSVQRVAQADYAAPKNELESRMSAIWQDVLKVERIGRDDNFFEVGGTSLLLVRAHAQFQRAFRSDISLVDMFRHPTIGSMAEFLRGKGKKTRKAADSRERAEQQSEAIRASPAVDRQRQSLATRRRRGRTAEKGTRNA